MLYHTEELLDVFGFPLCYADTVTMIPFFTVVTSSATSTQNRNVLSKFYLTSALSNVQNILYFTMYDYVKHTDKLGVKNSVN